MINKSRVLIRLGAPALLACLLLVFVGELAADDVTMERRFRSFDECRTELFRAYHVRETNVKEVLVDDARTRTWSAVSFILSPLHGDGFGIVGRVLFICDNRDGRIIFMTDSPRQ